MNFIFVKRLTQQLECPTVLLRKAFPFSLFTNERTKILGIPVSAPTFFLPSLNFVRRTPIQPLSLSDCHWFDKPFRVDWFPHLSLANAPLYHDVYLSTPFSFNF